MTDKEIIIEKRKNAVQGWAYSIERIDLLIISISGGGVYVIFETLKFFRTAVPRVDPPNLIYLKLSGGLFIVSIILNIVSQFTGKKSNQEYIKACDADIDLKKPANKNDIKLKAKSDDHKYWARLYTRATNALNNLSTFTMLAALVILLVYFVTTL